MHGLEGNDSAHVARDILPSYQVWDGALAPFLQLSAQPSTAITSPLRGMVGLIQREISESFKTLWLTIPRDSARCTAAFRMTIFTIKVLSSFDIISQLEKDDLETLFFFLPLAVQLIDDDLSIENCNGITGVELADEREEYLELMFQGRRVIASWIHATEPSSLSSKTSISSSLVSFWERKLEGLDGVTALDYRVGEAFVKIMSSIDATMIEKSEDEVAKLCRAARTANSIRLASWFAILRSSILSNPVGNRTCNELVAASTGIKPQSSPSDGLRTLSLLNILLSGEEDVVSTIPTQRLVFLTKNLIECLQSDVGSFPLRTEIMQNLVFVLPALAEIYGSHWEDTLEALSVALKEINGGEEGLPLLQSSFRLFICLKSMAEGDSNDDLKDVWLERKTALFNEIASTIGKFGKTMMQPIYCGFQPAHMDQTRG